MNRRVVEVLNKRNGSKYSEARTGGESFASLLNSISYGLRRELRLWWWSVSGIAAPDLFALATLAVGIAAPDVLGGTILEGGGRGGPPYVLIHEESQRQSPRREGGIRDNSPSPRRIYSKNDFWVRSSGGVSSLYFTPCPCSFSALHGTVHKTRPLATSP